MDIRDADFYFVPCTVFVFRHRFDMGIMVIFVFVFYTSLQMHILHNVMSLLWLLQFLHYSRNIESSSAAARLVSCKKVESFRLWFYFTLFGLLFKFSMFILNTVQIVIALTFSTTISNSIWFLYIIGLLCRFNGALFFKKLI